MTKVIIRRYEPTQESVIESYAVLVSPIGQDNPFETERVEARLIDHHYVLMSRNLIHKTPPQLFGVVDSDKPGDASNRLYAQARKLAEDRMSYGSVLEDLARGDKY